MKILITLLFMVNFNLRAAPPTSIKGEAGTAKYIQNLVLPNNQATQLTGINTRIETGNVNLLVNPSFEHTTVATGWTNTGGGTPAVSTTNLHDGVQSITTTSTGAWTFYQDATLYAAAKSGQDAEASIWVYSATASADLWLCPRINGSGVTASVTNGCVQYTNLGSPQKLSVYMLYGGASTGIEIKGSGAITYILDNAYLGDRRPSPLGITTTPWTSYTPTTQGFGTIASTECLYKRVGSDLYLQCKFTTGTTTGVEARVGFPSGTTSFNNFTLIKNVGNVVIGANDTASFYSLSEPSVSYVTIGRQGTSTAGLTKINGNAITSSTAVSVFAGPIAIAEWAGDNNAFTTKCDDPRQCEIVFSATAITTSGTVSNESLDFINGNCTAANPTVCSFNNGIFTVAPNCVATVANFNNTVLAITAVSSSSVTIRSMQGSSSADVATQTFNLVCQKQGADYTNSKVSQQIIQSRDVPKVPGGGSIDHFSFRYGTTNATTSCAASGTCTYLDQIGNAVTSVVAGATGTYTINFAKTYSKVFCFGDGADTAGVTAIRAYHIVSCSNCASTTFYTQDLASTNAISYGKITCDGTY